MLTTIYDAQNHLKTALAASPALSGVRVSLGHPGKLTKEEIWVGGEAEDWNFTYRQSGLVSRDEEFTLRISCFVQKTGATYEKARDRVHELSDAVEEVLANDPTFGGLLMLATVTAATLDEGISSDGRTRMVLETLAVRCMAHVDAG